MAKLIEITGKALAGEWGTDDDTGEGVPVLRTTNFTNDGVVNYNKVVTRTITKKNIEEKYLQSGDIIIEKSGGSDSQPVGRVVYFDGPEKTYLFNNFTGLLRIKDKKHWNPKYVFYSLYSNYKRGGTRQYENKTTGLHNLKTDDYVSQYEVLEKDINEQKLVCEKLDAIRNIILKREEQLIELDNLIKARFVEMFGDPEDNPKAWEKRPLSSIIVNANNGMARRGNDPEGSIVMRLVELQDGHINYSAPNRIALTEAERSRYLLHEGDFLFARVNGNPEYVGRCAVFYEIGESVYHNDHIIRVHFDDNVLNGRFASALLNSMYGKRQMRSRIKTSAGQYTISQDGIGAIVSILPPLELQQQFAAFVAKTDNLKASIQKSLDETQRLFDNLMQQYFS